MHIEPGLVDGAKIALSYATATAAGGTALYHIAKATRQSGLPSVALRALVATLGVFIFFEILPHFSAGVSEVHFILGSTLFLVLGAGPAAIGLAAGLLLQGLLVSPFDLPQYGMNLTTLLVPLFALHELAKRVVAPGTAYVDLEYKQVLALSAVYQGGVVAWVAFWVVYGVGFGAESLAGIGAFGLAYLSVLLIEPIVDLAVLGLAKSLKGKDSALVTPRLYAAA
jgi:ABC-type Co2+ transport system permease subunit